MRARWLITTPLVLAGVVATSVTSPSLAQVHRAAAVPACTITGTADDDVITGTMAKDVICGLGGNDRLYGSNGFDVLVGGVGDDQLFGGPGRDTIYGDDGFDNIFGDNGDDTLYGGAGGDTFFATRGATGATDDGHDIMSGGPDSDTARYARRLTSVRVTLDGLANDGAPGENDQAGVPSGGAGTSDVENIDGGTGSDVLVGTNGPNFLVSRGGADTMTALGGDDTIDTLDRVGDDGVNAGSGQDYCASDTADTKTSCETVHSG